MTQLPLPRISVLTWLLAANLATLSAAEPRLLPEKLSPDTECEWTIKYPAFEKPEDKGKPSRPAALPSRIVFRQAGEILEVKKTLGDGSISTLYLDGPVLLRQGPGEGIGVQGVLSLKNEPVQEWDAFNILRWIAPDNRLQKEDADFITYQMTDPLFGERVARIDKSSGLPVSYRDGGREILFRFGKSSGPITIPDVLKRARDQYLRVFPDGNGSGYH